MMSELMWGMIVAASAIVSVLVVLPLLERWSSPPEPPARSAKRSLRIHVSG
jgi:hypothetical protein